MSRGILIRMTKLRVIVAAAAVLVSGGAVAGWQYHEAQSAEAAAADQKRFEDISEDEYERWMQELGYTD
jgi:hypothetical protein